MTLVTMKHIRTAALCSGGTRDWFENHGFNWTDFLVNGIDAEKLTQTGDALAFRVVKIAKEEEINGRR